MNSRIRTMNTFAMEKCDRVPFDISLNPDIARRLSAHFKVNDYDSLLDCLDIDMRQVWPKYTGKQLFKQLKGRKTDPVYGFNTKWVEHGTGGYDDFCDYPLQNATEEEIESFPVPSPDGFDYSFIRDFIKRHEDRALYVGGSGICDVINATGRVMGMEDTLVNIASKDRATLNYINRRVDMEIGVMERVIESAKGRIDFLWMGEDLGTQNSPLISPGLYGSVIRPIHQKMIDFAKAYKLPVMMHSCGYSRWAFEDFIEMGVNAVDTLQPEAPEMNPASLARDFGGRLCFHGCISTAGPLAYGTPDDVEENVKATLEIMMPTKAYMLCATHSVQDNTPAGNVLRMFEAGKKYGRY